MAVCGFATSSLSAFGDVFGLGGLLHRACAHLSKSTPSAPCYVFDIRTSKLEPIRNLVAFLGGLATFAKPGITAHPIPPIESRMHRCAVVLQEFDLNAAAADASVDPTQELAIYPHTNWVVGLRGRTSVFCLT